MYMSYCRNEGTLAELRCVMTDVEAHINEEAEYNVSEREIDHFKSIVYEFYDFLCDNELLDCCGEIDNEVLDLICAKMRHGYSEEDSDEG